MSAQDTGPWGVVSGAIRRRVDEARQKHNAAEAQERQNEFDLIMEGVRAHAANGTLTDEMLEQAKGKMQKLVPKESHPLIDAFSKVMAHARDAKKRKKAEQQGQPQGQPAPAQGQPGGQTPPISPGPQPSQGPPRPGVPVPPGTSGGGTPAPPQALQAAPAPSPAPTPTPGTVSGQTFPSAQEMGTAAGVATAARDTELATSRLNTIKAIRKTYADRGDEIPKETDNALTLWAATGHMTAAMTKPPKMHPVSIEDPDGSGRLIPGMQEETPEATVYANGLVVEHPRIAPKWKPRKAVMKDANGKFFSANIDPVTNQPIPGTENYQELPPAAYLDKLREHEMMWFDDAGNQHIASLSARTFVNVPSNAGPGGSTPTVPPAFRKLPKAQTGKGAGAGAPGTAAKPKTSKYDKPTGATKDTDLLSPGGQKVLMTTEPVLNQAKKLEKIFDDNPDLKTNDTAGYLLLPYILYRLGYATDGPLQEEIAGLSLGSVVEAASALQGTTRAISGLRLAMVHTPNAKVDSPEQIYRKLHNDIIPRLEEIEGAAKKYGRKRASVTVPPDMEGPPVKSDADKAAEEWLRTH